MVMNAFSSFEDINNDNQCSSKELIWVFENSGEKFSMHLAICNSVSLRQSLVAFIQQSCPFKIREVVLTEYDTSLYTRIEKHHKMFLSSQHPIFISGLDSVANIEKLVIGANRIREEFKNNFSFPLVFWVTDKDCSVIMRLGADFYSWCKTITFTIDNK